ncbi:hypothetical protein JRI60_31950 [Archangium violaceum]|uniref:hypothetical protein n=1 Tax=Archangium violaceum TaxID=83451 RepID=UPI00194FA827|nr:hypothetical protein [Archangium violaceum]QRN93768.1 hypothetical protein JRI60_31950 [Archangium violaceum]
MKRVIVSLMVGLGALLSACTEEDTALPYAGLVGTYDLALVGERVFVTSSGNNELRVLELARDLEDRQYARAPNPIEPLSIPVLKRPEALTRDVRYDDAGAEVAGPYVYARSNGSTEISVVGADPSILREVRRLSTPELSKSSTGPVTAFAARGPDAEGLSTLYYATQETTGAQLWQLRLPGPEALLAGAVIAAPTLLRALPNLAVSSILVMPNPRELAVATRGAAGVLGKSYKLNLDAGAGADLELNFGGAQVLQLATHPQVTYVLPEGSATPERTLQAGERIFGVLDASSCGGQSQCSGVLAVDSATGTVSKDITGFPMLPITGNAGLPMGLSLSPNTQILLQSGTRSVVTQALLGIVPLSDGEILFFDAALLRPFDVIATAPSATVSFVNSVGTSQTGSSAVVVDAESGGLTNGVTRNNTYTLVYQGVLPGMNSVPYTPGSAVFELPPAAWTQGGQQVRPGDIIVLTPETTGQQPCATDVVVGSVQPPASAGANAVLVPAGAIPPECANFTRFQVRAAGNQPLVLSDSTAFLQRLGVSETYTRTGPYYFHPDGYAGQTEGVDVRITVARLTEGIVRDERYVVNTLSNYFPFGIQVDLSIPALQTFRLPGPVVQATVGDTSYAYIAYPSADGILQVNLEAIFVDVTNSTGVYPYR